VSHCANCAQICRRQAQSPKNIGMRETSCIEGFAYGEAGWRGIFVEPAGGLEPPTHGLQIHCATRCATPADIAIGLDLRPFDSPRQRKGAESQGSTAMGQYGQRLITRRVLVERFWKALKGPKCMAEWTPAGTEEGASHAASGRGLSTRMDTVSNGVDPFRGERIGGRSREWVAEWRSGEAWEGVGDGMARNLLEVLRRSAGRGGGCAHRDC
jgi:hypothetical protein